MSRNSIVFILSAALLFMATPVVGQSGKMDKDIIKNAMSAAPPSISAKATIMGWATEEGGDMPVLRKGSNGWTCMPDMPGKAVNALQQRVDLDLCLQVPLQQAALVDQKDLPSVHLLARSTTLISLRRALLP